jgi:hypothetical protein
MAACHGGAGETAPLVAPASGSRRDGVRARGCLAGGFLACVVGRRRGRDAGVRRPVSDRGVVRSFSSDGHRRGGWCASSGGAGRVGLVEGGPAVRANGGTRGAGAPVEGTGGGVVEDRGGAGHAAVGRGGVVQRECIGGRGRALRDLAGTYASSRYAAPPSAGRGAAWAAAVAAGALAGRRGGRGTGSSPGRRAGAGAVARGMG